MEKEPEETEPGEEIREDEVKPEDNLADGEVDETEGLDVADG